MPIIVNVPGGKLDTAGRGAAAAQGFRLNEREADRRDMAFKTEREIALRKIDLEEQDFEFQKEQLAQQQTAEADTLLGMAIESGMNVGDQGAYRRMLSHTSPRFRSQMVEEFGRSARVKLEQAQLDEIMGEIELTPETQKRVEAGELRELPAIQRAMAKERGQIARTADQEQARVAALDTWTKRQSEPNFDMPDETMDPEAHGDVMEILGELSEGAATNPKTNYRALNDQLTLLTTKGMRDAAMAILQRDIGGVDPRGLPRSSRMDAMGQPGFAGKAEGEYFDQAGAKAQSGRNADDPNYEARKAKAGASGSTSTSGAPKASAPAGESLSAGGAGGPPSRGALITGKRPVPLPAVKPKTVADLPAGGAVPKVDDDKAELARTALKNLGMKKAPDDGTPEFAKWLAEVKRLEKEKAKAAEKSASQDMVH
jgi:hypothetical protein